MITFHNIHLVGTSHVSKESITKIRKAFEINPDIVAIELDENRAINLEYNIEIEHKNENNKLKNIKDKEKKKSKKKDFALIKEIGLLGFLFYKLGESLQKKYGDILNVNPGLDMYEAIKLAKEKNIPIYFIDRDIKFTLSRFSKKIKKRELLKIFFEFLFYPFATIFKKEKINFDISKIPDQELIDYVLTETKKSYPSIYKVLIDERDLYMAKKLFILSNKYSDKIIIAVIGAGHVKGILNYLEKLSKSHADIAY
ncbi:MAG: TraB domain-containing protein [Candidatus Woesearchaeota archaeon]